jgi:hypothetical protein
VRVGHGLEKVPGRETGRRGKGKRRACVVELGSLEAEHMGTGVLT